MIDRMGVAASTGPRGEDRQRRGGPGAGGGGRASTIAILAAISLFAACGEDPEIVQLIQFSHKRHIQDAGLECRECHTGVETQAHATRPTLETCRTCHEDPVGESAEERRVVDAIQAETEIAWKPVYDLPAHINFSHARHVTAGRLACSECHGDMPSRETPPPRPTTPNTLWMSRCLECHRQRQVTEDCYACHR